MVVISSQTGRRGRTTKARARQARCSCARRPVPEAGHGGSVEDHGAPVGPVQQGGDPGERGLAAAAGTEQAEGFAGAEREVRVADGGELAGEAPGTGVKARSGRASRRPRAHGSCRTARTRAIYV